MTRRQPTALGLLPATLLLCSTLLLGAPLLLGACQAAEPERAPNLILLLVDTLRADRVGVYGSSRGLTPFVDSLAERATVYHNAYSTSSWTNPAVASLLTSRHQSQHQIRWFNSVLAAEERTLPEILSEGGYQTAGFVANPLVDAKHGFAQGFDLYRVFHADEQSGANPPAPRLHLAALKWLQDERDVAAPFFLYLHYMEPHSPYHPPAEILEQVAGSDAAPDLERANQAMRSQASTSFDAQLSQEIQTGYDAEVSNLDRRIEGLFAQLGERGLLDDSVVIFTADHGEEFWEHDRLGHNQTLFEESIRIPLLLIDFRAPERRDVLEASSLLDVAPTLLRLAGIAVPESFAGRSLTASEDTGRRARAVAELWKPSMIANATPHRRAIVEGRRKLIERFDGQLAFYDLSDDPAEADPDALDEPARSRLRELAAELESLAAEPGPTATQELDAKALERLRALGYLE